MSPCFYKIKPQIDNEAWNKLKKKVRKVDLDGARLFIYEDNPLNLLWHSVETAIYENI